MVKRVGKRLSDANINSAVLLLDSWSGKLTWEVYLSVLEVEIGHKYTKAAMLRHNRIKAAWDCAKSRVRKVDGGHGTVGLNQAKLRIYELKNRVERLEKENNQLLEQFVRWANNAVNKGLTIDDLDRPLQQEN